MARLPRIRNNDTSFFIFVLVKLFGEVDVVEQDVELAEGGEVSEDAALRVLGEGAHVDADAFAVGDVADDRQEFLEAR